MSSNLLLSSLSERVSFVESVWEQLEVVLDEFQACPKGRAYLWNENSGKSSRQGSIHESMIEKVGPDATERSTLHISLSASGQAKINSITWAKEDGIWHEHDNISVGLPINPVEPSSDAAARLLFSMTEFPGNAISADLGSYIDDKLLSKSSQLKKGWDSDTSPEPP